MQVSPAILKERFLELYPNVGHIQRTCEILGIVPRTLYHWRKNDLVFKEQFEEIQSLILIMLEDEAIRRAVDGVDKPIYYQGTKVGTEKVYSDFLLHKLLVANSPKYKDKSALELSGPDGKALESKIIHVTSSIPLANSEDEVLALEQGKPSASSIQDVEYDELPRPGDIRSMDPETGLSADDQLETL